MRMLRLALAQVDPTVGDLRGNGLLVRRWLAKAEAAGADLALFPEMTITGYPPEDLVLRPSFIEDALSTLKRLAQDVGETAVVVGFVDRSRAGIHNAAALLHRGRIRAVYHKQHLPNYGVFDEERTFEPGGTASLFEIRGIRTALTICEDAWIDDGPVAEAGKLGAELVVNVSASPYHRAKGSQRRALFARQAKNARVHFALCNLIGGQDELVFDGESMVVSPDGAVLARGAQFAEDLLLCELSLPDRPRRLSAKASVAKISGPSRRAIRRPELPDRTRRAMEPAEEVYAALLLGTRDYARKNGFTQAVIGLSGGIDSALTAVVAADAFGARNVMGVAMPSEITSHESTDDAKALATNLGIEFRVVPIAEILERYLDALTDGYGNVPAEARDNLQARIRGTILMGISNAGGGIVLATGNKSEMATGYSTLYGDMAGGFAVLKDVPKTLVYEVARWRNERGPAAIPDRVFTKPPTAELHAGQLDTDALPPYEVLDPILEAYVERDRSIKQIVAEGFDEAVVRRVARMVDQAEYKRRQAAPGVKISPRAFGKDRRIPVTNRYREWAIDDAAAARQPTPKKKGRRPRR